MTGPGRLTVVGLGPGGPDWCTPAAARRLGEATDLVGYGPYLDRLPPGPPGQRRHPSDNRQEADRARDALDLAAEGHDVVVVSSGDPGVFAMAAAVVEALDEGTAAGRYAGLDVTVEPGVTAATAAAARRGAALGHDFCVISLSDVLKPWEVVERRLEAAAGADFVLALYNPASSVRPWQCGQALAVIARHRSDATPVVVARDVGGRTETTEVVPLGKVDPGAVDMRTVLIVGSSTTRSFTDASGRDWAYTPRRYP